MFLTVTSTEKPATNLGYLLHKNPQRPQTHELTFGKAHVFYPVANDKKCTAVLMLDINSLDLARTRKKAYMGLFDYVNDRPYVSSSFLSVALSQVYSSAMAGRCKKKPELVDKKMRLKAVISMVKCKGGEEFIRKLFEPLGYSIAITSYMLDDKFEEWGKSPYYTINLENNCTLKQLLNHVYILLPVLDNKKHYWIGKDEVEKLLNHGQEWLAEHPDKSMIINRYLNYKKSFANIAFDVLTSEEETEEREERPVSEEALNLNQQRLGTVMAVLKSEGINSVIDLGCGEGKLLKMLQSDRQFNNIAGMDVSVTALERARDRLRLDDVPEFKRERINLFQGSLMYRDKRFSGYDAATVIEVIEHFDISRLAAFEKIVFGYARPRVVVITTPNFDYNKNYENLMEGNMRHRDHRFEWTGDQFQNWCLDICIKYRYSVRFIDIGDKDSRQITPTQMGVFKR